MPRMLCRSADSGTRAPRYALPATRRPCCSARLRARATSSRRRPVGAVDQRQVRVEPFHAAAPACRRRSTSGTRPRPAARSTIDAGTASPKSSSDRTPYSWIGPIVGDRRDVSRRLGQRLARSRRTCRRSRATLPRSSRCKIRLNAPARSARLRRQARRIDLDARIVRPEEQQIGFSARDQHRLRKHVDERANHRQRGRAGHLIRRQPLADDSRRLEARPRQRVELARIQGGHAGIADRRRLERDRDRTTPAAASAGDAVRR